MPDQNFYHQNGRDTACRVEESLNPKKSAVQTINEIFPNPKDRAHLQQQQSSSINDSSSGKINEIHDMVKSLLKLHKCDSAIGEH